MTDREEDRYPEDSLAVGKGILFGVLFGALLWAGIIACVWYWLL